MVSSPQQSKSIQKKKNHAEHVPTTPSVRPRFASCCAFILPFCRPMIRSGVYPSIHRIRSHHTTSQNPRDQTLPPVRWPIVHRTKLSVQFRIHGLVPKTGYFTINGDKTFASRVVEATCSGRLDPVPAAGNLNGI